MSELFITSLSGASARQAVVEDLGASVWLFMTQPDGEPPVADCFLYNTGSTPSVDAPPPLEERFASGYQVRLPVNDEDVRILWSRAGDAVAVQIHGEYVGFIGPDDLRGYSRSVAEDCDWAHAFDIELFERIFGAV